MTESERTLLTALADLDDAEFPARRMPGEVAVGLGMPPRLALSALRGLAARGFYEYDISLYSGRLTRAGREAAQRMKRT
jgi:Mn-dependent DtxR family transcriptional regulator